jgi:hypothetical protein
MLLPNEAQSLLVALAPAFTAPTFSRFTLLMAAAVLTTGRRTVTNLLRTLSPFCHGHPTNNHPLIWPSHGGERTCCRLLNWTS